MNVEESKYWTERYQQGNTGWNIGYPSTPIKAYIDQLQNKSLKILIPGAGNAYEAEYLWENGFTNVYVMDISPTPLNAFQKRNPDFPENQLLHEDFFRHKNHYDLIFEQTFFCSFVPTDKNRYAYAHQMNALLNTDGKLVGVWFDIPLGNDLEKRPFGGDKKLYTKYLSKHLKTLTFEPCYNSIPPRQGNELFGIFIKE